MPCPQFTATGTLQILAAIVFFVLALLSPFRGPTLLSAYSLAAEYELLCPGFSGPQQEEAHILLSLGSQWLLTVDCL